MIYAQGNSFGARVKILLLALLMAVPMAMFFYYLWREWTLYAVFFSTLYYAGGVRFLSARGGVGKAFLISIFLGLSCAVLLFLWGLMPA